MSDTPAVKDDPSKTGRSTARKRKPVAKKAVKASTDKTRLATAPAAEAEAATPSAPAPVALIRVPMSVRWRDLDAFNHVNDA